MRAYQNIDDQELIARLRNGDQLAFTEIYNRYKHLLQNHAYKKLGDFDEVKDVLQEVFTNLWNKRQELPITSNLCGYLYTGIRNRILNNFAHKQVQNKYTASLQQFAGQGNYNTDALIREKELALIIQKEIDRLPVKMREIFILNRKENLTHREIATRLAISEQTVSKQITNALKVLRVRLGSLFVLFF
jgi:RNA polymerase sigma-70 factor (ECF subfamily)